MSQNLNVNNSMGSISKIRTTESGRIIYQVTDANGKESAKLSVNANDCDRFEKAYNDITTSAPKLQKYMQNTTEKKLKRLKKISRWIIGLGTGIGAAIPIFTTAKLSTFKQVLCTIGGTIAGFVSGAGISSLTTTPPGALKLSKATRELQKLDIQPVLD